MAEEVQLRNSSERAKIRNPLGVVGLTFITVGIYGIWWYYTVNKEMAAFGQANGTEEAGTNPTNSLLALIPGGFILVPAIMSYLNCIKRLNAVERMTHGGPPTGVVVGVLMIIFFPVGGYMFQSALNKAWQAQAGPVGAPAM